MLKLPRCDEPTGNGRGLPQHGSDIDLGGVPASASRTLSIAAVASNTFAQRRSCESTAQRRLAQGVSSGSIPALLAAGCRSSSSRSPSKIAESHCASGALGSTANGTSRSRRMDAHFRFGRRPKLAMLAQKRMRDAVPRLIIRRGDLLRLSDGRRSIRDSEHDPRRAMRKHSAMNAARPSRGTCSSTSTATTTSKPPSSNGSASPGMMHT